jgi:uncharacterized protein (TIGR02145 family)
MKNVVKKQCKKFPLWGLKGLLSVALCSLGIVAFAQGAEVCQGTSYTIADAVPASAGSEYRWVENGNVLRGTNQATFDVLNTKAAGVYTYVRQSRSADCPDWQSSNEFTVTVFNCNPVVPAATCTLMDFVDPRDGKKYKIVKMPDDKIWFAQNLNYTKDLTFNKYSKEANGRQFTSVGSGVPAIGSYWCPAQYWVNGSATVQVVSGSEAECNTYGALYTWETAMMVDGKYADEAKTNSAWDESWVSGNYLPDNTVILENNNANKNNARGGVDVKGGGRGICPMGWHVPTDYEWANMLNKINGTTDFSAQSTPGWVGTDESIKLKSSGTFLSSDNADGKWLDNADRGTNEICFCAVPAGYRYSVEATFVNRGRRAAFWTSTVQKSSHAWYWHLRYNYGPLYYGWYYRTTGLSVRCVKD